MKDGSLLWRTPVDAELWSVTNGVAYLAKGKGGCTTSMAPYADVDALHADTGQALWHFEIKQ